MNERYNRIAGCQMAVDAARAQCDVAARRLADWIVTFEDDTGDVWCDTKAYRAAQEAYADALDQLADALRR
jgi:predicted negative regulator of RcsB-dependent stress response